MLALAAMTVVTLSANGETSTQLWEGSTALGNWEGYVSVDASQLSSVVAEDLIEVTISDLSSDGDYHQLALKTMSDGWPMLSGVEIANVTEPGTFRTLVTDAIAQELKSTGLVVGGCYLTVSQVTLISDVEPSSTVWEGPVTFGDDWSTWAQIPVSAFRNAKVGDLMRLKIDNLGTGAQGHISCATNEGWLDIPDATEWVQLSGGYFQYTITEQMLPVLKGETGAFAIIVSGYNYTLLSVEIIDPATIVVPEVTVDHGYEGMVFVGKQPKLSISYSYAQEVPERTTFTVKTKTDTGIPVGSTSLEASNGHAELNLPVGDYTYGIFKYDLYVNDEIVESYNFALNPEDIIPTVDAQSDFDNFWNEAKSQLAAIDINPQLTLLPEESTSARNVYLVEINSVPDGLTGEPVIVRGYYAEPVADGTYPAILHFQGYDSEGTAKPYTLNGDSNPGYVEFVLSTRGQVINNRPPYENTYGDWFAFGFDNKDHYYYRGAYMDCVRAIDFVASRSKVDTNNIFAEGQSQGGAFTIAAAALGDGRLNCIAPAIQFMGDFPNYFQCSAWPGQVAFAQRDAYGMTDEQMYEMLSYFDTKNLSKFVSCPVLSSIGLQDPVCPPRTNLAPYNLFSNTDKTLVINPMLGHQTNDEWYGLWNKFFEDHMNKNGIESMRNDLSQCDVEYYTLNGFKVSQPTIPGFYLVKRGATVTKEVMH